MYQSLFVFFAAYYVNIEGICTECSVHDFEKNKASAVDIFNIWLAHSQCAVHLNILCSKVKVTTHSMKCLPFINESS